ncbi:MAG: serine hydrolase [Nocardioides sp.]
MPPHDHDALAVESVLDELSVTGTAYAGPIAGGDGVGLHEHELVTPASVIKIQVALATQAAIDAGTLDGERLRILRPERRTPGPVGISLLRDEVRMSARDLLVQMLTVSDNVATDELIGLVGLDTVNALTTRLGLDQTIVASDLRTMLDEIATSAGFSGYAELAAYEPGAGGPSGAELRGRLHASPALDPQHGSRTTAAETVRLLQLVWSGTAAAPATCAVVRRAMARQLTRHRIVSGFGSDVAVAAKSGGLLGVVRNEVGVVTLPTGEQYAIAVFTRSRPGVITEPSLIDAGIGRIARLLVDGLHG